MSALTIKAKFPGVCRNCKARISKGSTIAYYGRGAGISCAACVSDTGLEPGTLVDTFASDRALARSGLTVVRFPSGDSYTRNSLGRCEDAPCCGCCTI